MTGDASDSRKIAYVALTEVGGTLAARLRDELGGVVFGKHGRVPDADRPFDDAIACLGTLYREGWSILGLCSAGILVRALGPLTVDKWSDPPVIALSEDGAHVVPLLGSHHGGADLAERIAAATGGTLATTTGGDRRLGFALDRPPAGWRLATPDRVKPVTAALLAGAGVRLERKCKAEDWLDRRFFAEDGEWSVLISDRDEPDLDDRTCLMRPPVLAVGIGCERQAPAHGLATFVSRTLADAGLSRDSIAAIGSVDLKGDEPAMKALSAALDRPMRLFSVDALEALTPRLANPSEVVFQEIGCHGVAEAAALALAGPDGSLIVEKVKQGPYTCAVARAPRIDGSAGRAPGRLFVVGIGPGDHAWRTSEAVSALLAAEEVVGYRLYLDLAADLLRGKPSHHSDLGAEEARAAKALEIAATGKDVALVCSGDPGIYALATLVFELVERSTDRAVRGVDVTVVPGISAFQAAAARLGAPMGHDFCLISLSDLLTPRPHILKRLAAAAEGDFVTAFYNPQSKRRRDLLPEAKRILSAVRPPDTPVAVCRSLGRPEETISITPLADFDPESVDMFSLVVVGNSETRAFDHAGTPRMFTPRGYAGKFEESAGE